jgi:nucleolar complex protein 3
MMHLGKTNRLNSSKTRFRTKRGASDSDAEMSYEAVPRRRRPSWSDGEVVIDRLPIKLRDGKVKRTGPKLVVQAQSEEESEDHSPERLQPEPTREDITTGARFGRLSVIGVINNPSRKLRIQLAKEQIANICQEIVADPENSVRVSYLYLCHCRANEFIARSSATASHILSTGGVESCPPRTCR